MFQGKIINDVINEYPEVATRMALPMLPHLTLKSIEEIMGNFIDAMLRNNISKSDLDRLVSMSVGAIYGIYHKTLLGTHSYDASLMTVTVKMNEVLKHLMRLALEEPVMIIPVPVEVEFEEVPDNSKSLYL